MKLMERIAQDMTAAMKAKDQARLSPLRMAKAALMNREVEKGRALEDAEAEQVLASLIKQRRDSIEQFTKGGRQDLGRVMKAVMNRLAGRTVDGRQINELVRRRLGA
jgi:uncharacterized protein YqeY